MVKDGEDRHRLQTTNFSGCANRDISPLNNQANVNNGTNLPCYHFNRWVQVACPRLSIDWGYAFPKPLLSPYEVNQLKVFLIALHVRFCKFNT